MGRIALCSQGGPLPNAKPMLLVNDHQPEIIKIHGAGKQRMGAHDDFRRTHCNIVQDSPALGSGSGAGEQHAGNAQRRENVREVLIVLVRQKLCGGHEHRLIAIFHCLKHSAQGHHGFAGANVTLHQPVHGAAGEQIIGNLLEAAALGVGQVKREAVIKILGNRLCTWIVAFLPPPGLHESQTQRIQEEFLENQPPPCLGQGLRGGGMMYLHQRLIQGNQLLLRQNFGGKLVGKFPLAPLHGRGNQALEHPGGQALGEGIDGNDAPGGGRGRFYLFYHGIGQFILPIIPGKAAVEIVFRALTEILTHPGLIEPGDAELGGIIGDGAAGIGEPLAHIAGAGGGEHHGPEAGRLLGCQLGQSDQLCPVLIVPGIVVNEVLQGDNAQLFQLCGPGSTNAF